MKLKIRTHLSFNVLNDSVANNARLSLEIFLANRKNPGKKQPSLLTDKKSFITFEPGIRRRPADRPDRKIREKIQTVIDFRKLFSLSIMLLANKQERCFFFIIFST